MSDTILTAENLKFRYDAEQPVYALDGVSAQVKRGEFVAVLGANGCGKSTLAKHFNAILLPESGKVYVEGMDTADEEKLYDIRQTVGMVFQNPDNQIVATVVEEDVAFALENLGVPQDEMRRRVDDSMKMAGIYEYRERAPHNLSGGQKQRVAIARALATRPKYLLCDEATSALDPNTTQSILRLLKQINQTLGVTIVVITHEMRVIEQICKRVAVIDQSRIAEIGNVSDVFTHPKSDIAKALILPKSPAENLPPCTGKRLRLVFDGSCSNEPVISRITLECHVPVNILFADTRIVEGSIYGHMVIDLPDDPQQFHDVLRWLDHNHISYLQED